MSNFAINLSSKQRQYVFSKSPTTIYAGGVGAGKSLANIICALLWSQKWPGIRILICAPTYAMLHDTLIHDFRKNTPPQILKEFRSGAYPEAIVNFGGESSQILFRAFDDAMKPRSITIGGLIVDEVVALNELVLHALLDRLRQSDMPNYARFSTNTDSKQHWFYQNYVLRGLDDAQKSYEYISTVSRENPFLPKNYLERLETLKETRPLYYRRMVLGEWVELDEDAIGVFEQIENFTAPYRVAFIDTSFSDRAGTDRTACAIVTFAPNDANKSRPFIEFTGKTWQKSISNADTMRELILFLDLHKPIETQIESQLADSTSLFLQALKNMERLCGVQVKNNFTVLHQTKNKHERIMFFVAGNRDRIRVLKNTEPSFLNPIISYTKKAEHDDEADALAGAINLWQTSASLRTYIKTESIVKSNLQRVV